MSIEQEIYNKLVEQFGVGEVCIKKYRDIRLIDTSWTDFTHSALVLNPQELHGYFKFHDRQALSKYFARNFPSIVAAKDGKKWSNFLLLLINKKLCKHCGSVKSLEEFSLNKNEHDGRQSHCKECVAYIMKQSPEAQKLRTAAGAKRRAAKLQATPNWADHETIKQIYETCPEGYHVDHIVPLQNDLVCGLHCEFNLQHLTAEENLSKGNKFTC